jgi:signal transduction histidine kinase/DNA-binding response OmpR family regulator
MKMLGVTAEDVLDKPLRLKVREGEGNGPLNTTDNIRYKRFTQLLETAIGRRWIEWEEQLVPAADGLGLEVQSIGRDVSEQRQTQAQLSEACEQAEAANRAKSRFLAAMSHEIRTPMNGILGMASLLLETKQTQEQETYTHAIDQSARTLLALIDEILDFSKIEAGKIELNEAPFVLETCIQETVELLAPSAHEKGLEIAWSIDPQVPRLVSGDEVRVRQILLNLLSNAVKFTDVGGVCVSLSCAEGDVAESSDDVRIEIAVEDTGIGLSQEDMKGLFAEFEQAEAAIHRRDGGTGLGLAISKQLAHAMGGHIRVVSRSGQGSTFTADLALQRVRSNSDEEGGKVSVATGRVLLAFDRPFERRSLAFALSSAGVPTAEVEFAKVVSALELAARDSKPFDRIVIDGSVGPAAAAEALALARKLNPGCKVRGIVLVNVLSRAHLCDFRASGFDAYLVRPVRPASMMMQLGLTRPASTASAHAANEEADLGSAGQDAPRRRLLLAEDNEINSLLAKKVVEKCGCDYVSVRNGAEAVAAVHETLDGKKLPFDLILMDIFMPQVDGIEATRTIRTMYADRREAEGRAPPIIALTANAFADEKKRYLEAGMDDYLAKPFDKASLEAVLRRWLEHSSDDAAA